MATNSTADIEYAWSSAAERVSEATVGTITTDVTAGMIMVAETTMTADATETTGATQDTTTTDMEGVTAGEATSDGSDLRRESMRVFTR